LECTITAVSLVSWLVGYLNPLLAARVRLFSSLLFSSLASYTRANLLMCAE
jgi:hypothetical protein